MKSVSLMRSKLIAKKSKIHGYGVFADQPIVEGDIIEECHFIIFNTLYPEVSNYCFKLEGIRFLPLGFGCIYNHSQQPNASYHYDAERGVFLVKANRKIEQGEEIFISYGEDWFSERRLQYKEPSLRFKLRQLVLPLMRGCLVLSLLMGTLIWINN